MKEAPRGYPAADEARQAILENAFIPQMRNLRIDRPAYVSLCGALEELARQWRGQDLVDRETAAALHEIATTARTVIPTLIRMDPMLRDELEDMGFTLGTLVQECFRKE